MNKKILFAAVGAALAVVPMISAQADVKVGGSAHLSVDSLDRGTASDTGSLFVSSNSSNIFVSASEDLGGGMKAIAYFEHLYTQDVSTSGQANRNNYVGLNGGFGTVKLGHFDDSMKMVGRSVDLFYNEQLGESRAITRQGNFTDERLANTVAYESNNMSGFTFAIQYGLEDSFTADFKTTVLGLNYKAGPLNVGVALKSADLSATTSTSATRIAGTYDMGAFKFAGFYQTVSDTSGVAGADRTTLGLGVAFKAGNNTFKAQWYKADELDNAVTTGGTQTSFGVDHNLSKTTVVYATYAKISNDTLATFGVGGNGHGASAVPAAGVDSSGFSLGMRMKF